MKKLLIMSIALVAIMATVFTVSAFAANTVEITGVTLSKYGSADTFNDAYANVTVNYTVTEDTAGAVDRLTFYLAAQDLASALEGEEAKIIYIDEQVEADAGSLTFVIEKSRVKSALAAKDDVADDVKYGGIENLVLTFKLGGTDVGTADSITVVYNNPTKYGDVDNNGSHTGGDASYVAQAVAGKRTFTAEQAAAGDINGDGNLTGGDTSYIAQVVAGKRSYASVLTDRAYAY